MKQLLSRIFKSESPTIKQYNIDFSLTVVHCKGSSSVSKRLVPRIHHRGVRLGRRNGGSQGAAGGPHLENAPDCLFLSILKNLEALFKRARKVHFSKRFRKVSGPDSGIGPGHRNQGSDSGIGFNDRIQGSE